MTSVAVSKYHQLSVKNQLVVAQLFQLTSLKMPQIRHNVYAHTMCGQDTYLRYVKYLYFH